MEGDEEAVSESYFEEDVTLVPDFFFNIFDVDESGDDEIEGVSQSYDEQLRHNLTRDHRCSVWTSNSSSSTSVGCFEDSTIGDIPATTVQNFWNLILIVFPLFTVFGNILVVLSVFRERSLQTVTNYFIVSLAIADIMVAILVMPLSIYVEVRVISGNIM